MVRLIAKYLFGIGLLALIMSCNSARLSEPNKATAPGPTLILQTATNLPTRIPTIEKPLPSPLPTIPSTQVNPSKIVSITIVPLAGLIVFSSERDGNSEIYTMMADGSGLRRLTNNQSNEHNPAWSPDGQQIIFESDKDDPNPATCFPTCLLKLYKMDKDGKLWQRMMDLPGSESHADWSPDGKKIAFSADRNNDKKDEIYVMNASGGMPIALLVDNFTNRFPDWSPDGKQIAFSSDRDGSLDIFTIDIAAGTVSKVVNTGLEDCQPDWSPDGKKILFSGEKLPYQKKDIFVIDANGNNLKRLTESPSIVDEDPRWSPDGRMIIFQSDRDGNAEIYIMNADGNNSQNVSQNPGLDSEPDWWKTRQDIMQINGKILFVSDRDGVPHIYQMNTDGSEQHRLTNNPLPEYSPRWSPDGKKIVYYTHLTEQSWALMVMNSDGTGIKRITENRGKTVCSFNPVWSPDGKTIGFTIELDPVPTCEMKHSEIALIDSDGTNFRILTENETNEVFYGWSPDSSQLLFTSNRDGFEQIYVMNDDGSNNRRLTDINSTNKMPAWSPNGKMIAFVSNRDGNDEIYSMDSNGGHVMRLTLHSGNNWQPAWSANGSQIIFASNRDGNKFDIYIMDIGGSNIERLTDSGGWSFEPVWQR